MTKRICLLLIFMITIFGIFSFKNNATESKTSLASFYHDKFNGRKTANGEIFSNKALTAANKTLPFGTEVKITNLKSGKSVIVRVNDRGPHHSARDFDLTKAAFASIGDVKKGTIAIGYSIIKK